MGCPLDDQTAWRKEQQQEVTGKESMTEMTQQDYVPLTRHFLSLAAGRNVYIDDKTYNDMDKAIHRLQDMMARHELSTSYVLAILRDQYIVRAQNCIPSQLFVLLRSQFTPREIINLSYTINSRGRAKTVRIQRDHALDGIPAEPYVDPSSIPPQGISDHFNIHQI